MTKCGKGKQRGKGIAFLAGALAVTAFLVSADAVEAGWKPNYGGAAAGGIAAGGLAYSLKENWRDALDKVGELLDAAMDGDSREVERISKDIDALPSRIGTDAFPVLAIGSRAVETSRAAVERIKKRLDAVKRRVGRFLGDPRTALSVGEGERQWYESESGILDRTPLPEVGVSHPSDTRGRLAVDPWGEDHAGWDAPRAGGSHSVGEWNEVLNEAVEADPWAPGNDELSLDRVEIDEETGFYLREEGEGETGFTLDYQEALADLERRQEAERERRERELAAEEERRRREATAEAERRRREAREYQRRAAERERRELEEELAARRNNQLFQNSIKQSIQMINRNLELLEEVRSVQGSSGGYGGTGSSGDRYGGSRCPGTSCGRP